MILIQNLTKRLVTFNVPELGSDAGVISVSHRDPVSGLKGIIEREVEHPRAVTLMPFRSEGDTSDELPDDCAESDEIRNALRAQPAQIKLTRVADAKSTNIKITGRPLVTTNEDI